MTNEVLDWPELQIRPELRGDFCRPRQVKPIPRAWHWMAFSFDVDSLVEVRGVLVLVPDFLSDELEAAQYLIYRAVEARLIGVSELQKVKDLSGERFDNLLFNVFALLEVRYQDRVRVINRIHAL